MWLDFEQSNSTYYKPPITIYAHYILFYTYVAFFRWRLIPWYRLNEIRINQKDVALLIKPLLQRFASKIGTIYAVLRETTQHITESADFFVIARTMGICETIKSGEKAYWVTVYSEKAEVRLELTRNPSRLAKSTPRTCMYSYNMQSIQARKQDGKREIEIRMTSLSWISISEW